MTPLRKLRMERKISKLMAFFPGMQLKKLIDLYHKLFPQPGYYVSTNDLNYNSASLRYFGFSGKDWVENK